MSGKPSLIPFVALNTTLPVPLRARLDEWLYSPLERRVPKGAYQAFFIARITEFFNESHLDLAPFLGTFPGEAVVRGPKDAIEALNTLLARSQHGTQSRDAGKDQYVATEVNGGGPLPRGDARGD